MRKTGKSLTLLRYFPEVKLFYYSQKYDISQIDDGGKKHVQLAWEYVGTPHVLKKLNWEGRARPDRDQKTGVEKFVITQQILGKFLTISTLNRF